MQLAVLQIMKNLLFDRSDLLMFACLHFWNYDFFNVFLCNFFCLYSVNECKKYQPENTVTVIDIFIFKL